MLRRTAASIFEPTADFERHGFVPDVVFPTGIVETDESFLVYYGAADSCTAVVEFFLCEELMAVLVARLMKAVNHKCRATLCFACFTKTSVPGHPRTIAPRMVSTGIVAKVLA